MEAGAFVVFGEKLVPDGRVRVSVSRSRYCTFIEGENIYCFIGWRVRAGWFVQSLYSNFY